MIRLLEIMPPEPYSDAVFQQMCLDEIGRVIAGVTFVSVLLILQLFFGFIKPQGRTDDDSIF